MENIEQVVKLLEEQVINKTLNLDGIATVQKIVEENKRLEAENKHSAELITALRIETKDQGNSIYKLDDKNRALIKTISEYEKKDKDFYEQGIRFEYEQKRGDELKEIIGMSLRNPTITASRFGGHTNENGFYQVTDDTTTTKVE